MGNALSGFIGTPTQNIYIGARPTDAFGKMNANIWNLAIQNTGMAWTQKQIQDHMNTNTIQAGANWYDFIIDAIDRSGGRKDLTLVSTTYSTDVPDSAPTI